ncbi:MAG: putative xanthine dehydrogenase subunit A [Firmicutes bacterium ADurb.Bin456]|nr:MAG: putative xanthine dehydrogenase subunit A [Firmicutes bacterium ADurb.Bin456]
MICGGQGEVLIDYVDAGDENNRVVYRAAVDFLERREKAWFVTVLESIPGAAGLVRQQCLVQPDGTLTGKVDSDPYLLEKLITGPAKISIHAEAFGRQRFLVEPLRQGGTVYIFGAGHVSQRIAALSETVGFRTVVMDDRAEFANRERFPEPVEIRLIDSFRKLPDLDIDGDSYLIIVTRGHLYDKIILEQVLRSGAGYIGMIGSRIKRDLTYEELIKQGFRLGELARVYSPIGTSIGAETPGELAISIVGELIMVRAQREQRKQRDGGESRASCCAVRVP